MSNLRLLLSNPQLALPLPVHQPFGRYLVNEGFITQADLVRALERQCLVDAPLGEILISQGLISRAEMLHALARLNGAQLVDLGLDPPERHLAQHLFEPVLQHNRLTLVA